MNEETERISIPEEEKTKKLILTALIFNDKDLLDKALSKPDEVSNEDE